MDTKQLLQFTFIKTMARGVIIKLQSKYPRQFRTERRETTNYSVLTSLR